jgi:hypothetical protein
VSKIVGGCVGLQSKLQLSHGLLFDGNFKSHVRNRDFVIESAFHFNQSVTFGILSDIIFDFMDSLDDVFDGVEDALASDHVTDSKHHRLLVL